MNIYREKISKDIDIDHISDIELICILEDMGRGLIYDYLLFGNDVTYDTFVEKMSQYIKLIEKLDK